MFSNIGPGEIAIVLLIALLVFGPKKLPELGRSLGQGMRDFKRGVSGEDEDERRAAEAAKAAAVALPPPGAPLEPMPPAPTATSAAAPTASDETTPVR